MDKKKGFDEEEIVQNLNISFDSNDSYCIEFIEKHEVSCEPNINNVSGTENLSASHETISAKKFENTSSVLERTEEKLYISFDLDDSTGFNGIKQNV